MASNAIITGLFIYACYTVVSSDYDPFADNVLFSVNWQGSIDLVDLPLSEDVAANANTMVMTTKDKEKYTCIIPTVLSESHQSDIDAYKGPNELTILKQLFQQTSCSYRIESYWTYELCHGRFLRQYHEEKEPGKKFKLQEYYLGHYRPAAEEPLAPPLDPPRPTETGLQMNIKMRLQKVDGVEIPYYAVNFTDGTKCDLTNTPRRVSIHYVCQQDGKGEVYGLKETSTCEYEVVVLTNLLCEHPAYKIKKEPINKIQCHSMVGSPRRPRSLDNMELENTAGRFPTEEEDGGDEDDDDYDDDNIDGDHDDGEDDRWRGHSEQEDTDDSLVSDEDKEPADSDGTAAKVEAAQEDAAPKPRPDTGIGSNTDKQLLTQFLTGDYCIQGGSGWWKHEFCYGKHVTQFHEEKNDKKVVLLGHWDQDRHIQWIKDNPTKKPRPVGQRKGVSHFYGMGDKCDLTGRNRWVEVKLKCKDYPNQPHAVAIYLVEPSPCEYSLVVESPILCPLIDQADEFGLIKQS